MSTCADKSKAKLAAAAPTGSKHKTTRVAASSTLDTFGPGVLDDSGVTILSRTPVPESITELKASKDAASTDANVDVGILYDGANVDGGIDDRGIVDTADTNPTPEEIPLVTDPTMPRTSSPQIIDLDDLFRCLERSQGASQAASNTNLDQCMELFERRIMTTLMTNLSDNVMTVAISRVTQAVDETVNKHITTISHKHIAETLDSIIKNKLEDGIHDSISKDKRVIATEL
jgi:hypothetical protein